jgi:hypothetical protein
MKRENKNDKKMESFQNILFNYKTSFFVSLH